MKNNAARLKNLKIRSLVLHYTRDFFMSQGYLEVETPIRCPVVIPEAHIDPVMSEDHFLQASPELFMKRLLAMGADKIFQICKCFRKGEQGHRHLPELTMLEWYGSGHTYEDLMDQCRSLIRHITKGLGTGDQLIYQGKQIDLHPPFEKITVHQAFKKFTQIGVETALGKGLFDELISFEIEPNLGNNRPCILYDYPAPLASLARLHPQNPKVAQRFELYISGIELANGFTELTDPKIQKKRFTEENRLRIQDGRPALPLPEKFLCDLTAMPKAAGIALGIDRLTMLFCDAASIDQVVGFTPEQM